MAILQNLVLSKYFKSKILGIKLARAHSYNVAHLFLTPLAQGGSGDSSGLPERPKRWLSGTYRPLFGRSSRPNAPVGFGFHHMIGSVRCISGVPGVM